MCNFGFCSFSAATSIYIYELKMDSCMAEFAEWIIEVFLKMPAGAFSKQELNTSKDHMWIFLLSFSERAAMGLGFTLQAFWT